VITEETIKKEIVSEEYQFFGNRTTICHVKFKNGFEVLGKAITQDPSNFNAEIGEKWALKDAIDQAFPAFIFLQDETNYRGWPEELSKRFQ